MKSSIQFKKDLKKTKPSISAKGSAKRKKPSPSEKSRSPKVIFDFRQFSILSDRYLECLIGDFSSFLWMLVQPVVIAGLIILRWKSYQSTETLHFVLSLSAVWFGCSNACREIAKEIPIYKQDRLLGMNISAYLASKIKILTLVGVVELGLFFFILNKFLALSLFIPLAFFSLFGLYFSGMTLGLMLSRWCGSVSKAVVSVPIALLPQIIFSKFVLPASTLKGFALKIEKCMVVKWGFEAMNNCATGNTHLGKYIFDMVVLLSLGVIFIILTLIHFFLFDE